MPGEGYSVGGAIPQNVPDGLKVLLVADDDPDGLSALLQSCKYEVKECQLAEEALSLLKQTRDKFDIVLSNMKLPDMDGLELLKRIGLQVDIPVILMSADDRKEIVDIKAKGVCDCLIKPICLEDINSLWKHAIRKGNNLVDSGKMESIEDIEGQSKQSHHSVHTSSLNIEACRSLKRPKVEEANGHDKDEISKLKRPRVVWTDDLHQTFVNVVDKLGGIDKAVPKKILGEMNVPQLTRENIASHLQKYRLYLKKQNGTSNGQRALTNPLMSRQEANYELISSLDGCSLGPSVQLPHQSLGIQPQRIGRLNANFRTEGVNPLSEFPTLMELPQLVPFQQSTWAFSNGDIHPTEETSGFVNSLHYPIIAQMNYTPSTADTSNEIYRRQCHEIPNLETRLSNELRCQDLGGNYACMKINSPTFPPGSLNSTNAGLQSSVANNSDVKMFAGYSSVLSSEVAHLGSSHNYFATVDSFSMEGGDTVAGPCFHAEQGFDQQGIESVGTNSTFDWNNNMDNNSNGRPPDSPFCLNSWPHMGSHQKNCH